MRILIFVKVPHLVDSKRLGRVFCKHRWIIVLIENLHHDPVHALQHPKKTHRGLLCWISANSLKVGLGVAERANQLNSGSISFSPWVPDLTTLWSYIFPLSVIPRGRHFLPEQRTVAVVVVVVVIVVQWVLPSVCAPYRQLLKDWERIPLHQNNQLQIN